MKNSSTKALIARCQTATKNASAAILLYRICFWMRYAKIIHDGNRWIANSASQWCEETGHTRDQYRRAVSLLRRLGLVETSQHLFGGKNITHVRLTELGHQVTAAQPDCGNPAPAGVVKRAPPEQGNVAQLHIHGDFYRENLKGESNTAFADAQANISLEKESKKDTGGDTEIWGGKNKKDIAAYEDTVLGLSQLWRDAVSEQYEIYVPPATTKQLGQLKSFRNACPPEKALAILDICVKRWSKVIAAAKSDYGAYSLPKNPTLEFLLKYAEAAINIALSELKQPEKTLIVSQKPLSNIVQAQNGIADCAGDIPATDEEVEEMLGSGLIDSKAENS